MTEYVFAATTAADTSWTQARYATVGSLVETTDSDKCTNCGTCVDICYFGARRLDGDQLATDRDNCYGCGLCIDACPEGSVEMTLRT
ncbi:4Fe-4S dicluster domain-containing protein [candidate division TA06 bacterium]|uniref:4Fe-4S dicluster domain-containing protein n=1 Tax=candidate division TA06 bacterium TaxID=2250710 RepID=A0A523XSC4_UNCT6|nr:MAG: 4Fe-4S dicluster domain-containing protein [candidate division TA06 bacterium]